VCIGYEFDAEASLTGRDVELHSATEDTVSLLVGVAWRNPLMS
jgi:hypothetical protein